MLYNGPALRLVTRGQPCWPALISNDRRRSFEILAGERVHARFTRLLCLFSGTRTLCSRAVSLPRDSSGRALSEKAVPFAVRANARSRYRCPSYKNNLGKCSCSEDHSTLSAFPRVSQEGRAVRAPRLRFQTRACSKMQKNRSNRLLDVPALRSLELCDCPYDTKTWFQTTTTPAARVSRRF